MRRYVHEGMEWLDAYHEKTELTPAYLMAMCTCFFENLRLTNPTNPCFPVLNPNIKLGFTKKHRSPIEYEDAYKVVLKEVSLIFLLRRIVMMFLNNCFCAIAGDV